MRLLLFVAALLFNLTLAAQSFVALDSFLQLNNKSMAGNQGGVTVVLQRAGNTLYQGSWGGFNEHQPVLIASASKWYAAMVLMRLVHKGKLQLDDKVSRYIPAFSGAKSNITLRQCFAHTSGLPGNAETLTELMGNRRQSLAQVVDSIARIPLVAEPGSQFNYGGLSMQVVGRVCEIAGGKPWNTLFKEEVVRPLGLTHTQYTGARLGTLSRVAGGIISTASDYLKLLEMMAGNGTFRGRELLSKKEVAEMLADQTWDAAIGYSPFSKYKPITTTGADARYGVGNWVILDGAIRINTSPGAFGFTPWIDRQKGYYGVVAVRSTFEQVMPFFWEMLQIINKSTF